MIKKALLLFSFSFYFTVSNAQDLTQYGMEGSEHPQGLEIGAVAPDFTAMDQNGKEVNLKDMLDDGPVVLVFYRGAWCPYCMRFLSNLTDSLDQITAGGTRVVAITPQGIDGVEKADKKLKNGLQLISDKDGSIMMAYKTLFEVTDKYSKKIKMAKGLDLAKSNNQESAQLPVPATYVIQTDGKIVARHFDYDYSKRYSVRAILAALNP